MTQLIKIFTDIEGTIEKFSRLISVVIRKTSPSIDQADLKDIEQEVKIKIWKEISKSEKKIFNLSSYIWRLTYTTTSRMMKRITRQRRLFAGIGDDNKILNSIENGKFASPNGEFEKKEIMDMINNSVNSLIESRRQVVKLYLTGMKLNEISLLMDWSHSKTRNLLYRGLEDLRAKLKDVGLDYESPEGSAGGKITEEENENKG
jgi:RNA polymerase sigma-70 factor (ECF subfamily)